MLFSRLPWKRNVFYSEECGAEHKELCSKNQYRPINNSFWRYRHSYGSEHNCRHEWCKRHVFFHRQKVFDLEPWAKQRMVLFLTRIIANYPWISENYISFNLRPICGNYTFFFNANYRELSVNFRKLLFNLRLICGNYTLALPTFSRHGRVFKQVWTLLIWLNENVL